MDASDFRLDPQDEYTHEPDAAANFNESVYMNAFDPKQRLGGWMRLGNRVNEGYAELSVCLYLPDGRVACQFQRPAIDSNDAFDAGGLRYEVQQPFERQTMRFDGELLLLDDPNDLRDPKRMFAEAPKVAAEVSFDATGLSPVHGGEPTSDAAQTMYGRDFSRGHFNQHIRNVGRMRVGEQEWQIDGYGWRDHSWGPRYWQAIYSYRLFIANFGDDRAFMLLKITDPQGRSRRVGVLMVDGDYEQVTDLDVTTEWSAEQDPERISIGVRAGARKELIEGRVITMAPLRNRRTLDDGSTLVSRVAEGFTEFAWDGRVGYGMTEYIERIEDGGLVGYPL